MQDEKYTTVNFDSLNEENQDDRGYEYINQVSSIDEETDFDVETAVDEDTITNEEYSTDDDSIIDEVDFSTDEESSINDDIMALTQSTSCDDILPNASKILYCSNAFKCGLPIIEEECRNKRKRTDDSGVPFKWNKIEEEQHHNDCTHGFCMNDIFKDRETEDEVNYASFKHILGLIGNGIDKQHLIVELEKTKKLKNFDENKMIEMDKVSSNDLYTRESIRINCELPTLNGLDNSILFDELHTMFNKYHVYLPVCNASVVLRRTEYTSPIRPTNYELKIIFMLKDKNNNLNVTSKIAYEYKLSLQYKTDINLLCNLIPIFTAYGEYKRKVLMYSAGLINDVIWENVRYNCYKTHKKIKHVMEIEYNPDIIKDSLDLYLDANHFNIFYRT